MASVPPTGTTQLKTPYADRVFSLSGSSDDRSVWGAISTGDGKWEPHVMQAMSRLIRPTDVCMDIGANIGVYTLVMSELAHQGVVHAFEPSETNASFLARNITDNGLPNAHMHQIGLSDAPAQKTFYYFKELAGCSFIAPEGESIEDVLMSSWGVDLERTSETITIDTLDAWYGRTSLDGVDFIKMDVEGSELFAINGGRSIFDALRPTLLLEFNTMSLQKYYKVDPSQLHGRLTEIYSHIYVVPEDLAAEPTLVENYADLEPYVTGQKFWADVLCMPLPMTAEGHS